MQKQAGDEFDDVMQKHATDPEPLKQLLAAIPKPLCPAFSRVVTSHGDLWYANVLHSPNPGGGLVACDIESACVMSAIWDFMHGQIQYFEADTKLVHEHSGGEGTSFARVMVEAYLQKELMISRVMRTDMNEYRIRFESEQTVVTLLEIPEKWMALRALNRTTGREQHYSSTQFGGVNFQPEAQKYKNGKEKGPAAIADKNQKKGDRYGDGSGGVDPKAKDKWG